MRLPRARRTDSLEDITVTAAVALALAARLCAFLWLICARLPLPLDRRSRAESSARFAHHCVPPATDAEGTPLTSTGHVTET